MSRIFPLLKPNHFLDASLALASVVNAVLFSDEPVYRV